MFSFLRARSIAEGSAVAILFLLVAPAPAAAATTVTTVITHGFQLASGNVPSWVTSMAKAILELDAGEPICDASPAGGPVGTVLHYTPSTRPPDPPDPPDYTGTWVEVCGSTTKNGPVVLIFDWAQESDPGLGGSKGFSEAAADVLYAALRDPNFSEDLDWDAADIGPPYHFIGHSRGTIVNSETVERLTLANINVDQVTTIDPHPVDGTLEDEQTVAPFPPEWGDSPPQIWGRTTGSEAWGHVTFADNYFREDGGLNSPGHYHGIDFDGTRMPWDPSKSPGNQAPLQADHQVVADCDIFDLGVELVGNDYDDAVADGDDLYLNHEHSRIHAWYHGTIDTDAPDDGAQPTAFPIDPLADHAWYYDRPIDSSEHDCVPERDKTGYAFSLIGLATNSETRATAGPREQPGEAGSSPSAGFSPLAIYNGDFEIVNTTVFPGLGHAGWRYQGGDRMAAEIWSGTPENYYFRMNSATSPLTHNWIYVDATVQNLYLQLRVRFPGIGELYIDLIDEFGELDERIATISISEAHGWQDYDSPVLASATSHRLQLSYVGTGQVDIDNISFAPNATQLPGLQVGWLLGMVGLLMVAGLVAAERGARRATGPGEA